MAIKIEIDHNSHGDKFRVLIQNPGFGRGKSERGLTLNEAFELARHYFMDSAHVKTDCR